MSAYEALLDAKRHKPSNYGIELKESYYKQAIRNLATVKSRFDGDREAQLFDEVSDELIDETEPA